MANSTTTTPQARPRSVLRGRDPEALGQLLRLHMPSAAPRILDATHNTGKMWRGLDYRVTSMDIDPRFEPDVVGDFRAMPLPDASFDVIVFDPPHLPVAAATAGSSKLWETKYGITADVGRGRDGANVSAQFVPFLREARRVLVPHGIVLCKIADLVHNARYQWQQVDFINAAREVGMTPCDMLIKADPSAGNLTSSKWKTVRHFRKAHCYWIVVRNSSRCDASGFVCARQDEEDYALPKAA